VSIIIKSAGLYSTIQDAGRRGLRQLGIPWAGVGSEPWMRFANVLLDQPQNTPVIETIEAGLSLTVQDQPLNICVIGDAFIEITRANGSVENATTWETLLLHDAETLSIKRTGRYRSAVIGIRGIQITAHYGSCATYANAGLGGLTGAPLTTGDCVPTNNDLPLLRNNRALPPYVFNGEVHSAGKNKNTQLSQISVIAVPGPQDDAFTEDALDTFFSQAFTVSQDIDRMGARLTGPVIEHKSLKHRDLISDAILPGSVQIPGAGAPIVMLSDAHTMGGYPKIATVASADLALFSLCRPGVKVAFKKATTLSARSHTQSVESAINAHISTLFTPKTTQLSSEDLLASNLIDGVTNALDF
jgi:5-oxoprolinase (ATP-hydrolysing) subunit C